MAQRLLSNQNNVFLLLFTIFHFDDEKFISKHFKHTFFYQKVVNLGETTSKYCNKIIVIHVHATSFFLTFTQRVTILQTVSNQEVIQKRLISMLRIAQKLYVGT